MGDRGNIEIRWKDGEPSTFFYTHWSGTELPDRVAKVIARDERWGDQCYLARMLFCGMMDPDEMTDSMGFGIGPYVQDMNHNPTVVIDMKNMTVDGIPFSEVKSLWDKCLLLATSG